jgi:hypothetical protein
VRHETLLEAPVVLMPGDTVTITHTITMTNNGDENLRLDTLYFEPKLAPYVRTDPFFPISAVATARLIMEAK